MWSENHEKCALRVINSTMDDEDVEMIGVPHATTPARRPRRRQTDRELETRELKSEFNSYATSKSVSQSMLNVSTIQGLLVIMVNTFHFYGTDLGGFQIGLIVLICLSITLQFIIFVLLVVLAKATDTTGKIVSYNMAVTSLSGLLLIVTSAISILAIYVPTSTPAAIAGNITQ